jgi:hypothetical protein
MATCRQAVEALDVHLRLPSGVARWHADRLRTADLIPSTQGRPAQISSADIALILLSILTGTASDPERVAEYANLRPSGAIGPKLIDVLARLIEEPADLFELSVDEFEPAARVTFRGAGNGMVTLEFASDESRPRPAFQRMSVLGPAPVVHLAAAIKAAPPVRPGRRRRRNRFARIPQ